MQRRTRISIALVVWTCLVTGCDPGDSGSGGGNEGYLLTYIDGTDQVRVRFSADGQAWSTGTLPGAGMSGAQAVGVGVDNSGVLYQLGVRDANGLTMYTGLGASAWSAQAGQASGTEPVGDGAPAIAWVATDRWLVAQHTAGGNLSASVYNPNAHAWLTGNIAPQTELTGGMLGDPTAVSNGGRVVLAWQRTSGLVTAVGNVQADGSVSIGSVQLLEDPGTIPPPRSRPFLTKGGNPTKFYLAFIGAMPLPPSGGSLGERPQVVVLSSDDGVAWTPYAVEPNPDNAQHQLRGVAGRSDGSLLIVKQNTVRRFDPASGGPGAWTDVTGVFDPAPGIRPLNFVNTGRR